jgi:hypothetical protein
VSEPKSQLPILTPYEVFIAGLEARHAARAELLKEAAAPPARPSDPLPTAFTPLGKGLDVRPWASSGLKSAAASARRAAGELASRVAHAFTALPTVVPGPVMPSVDFSPNPTAATPQPPLAAGVVANTTPPFSHKIGDTLSFLGSKAAHAAIDALVRVVGCAQNMADGKASLLRRSKCK